MLRFLPAALALAMAGLGVIVRDPRHPRFLWAVLVGAGLLVAWNAWLLGPARRARGLTVNVDLRKQHYVQALAHTTIFVWWGSHIGMPLVWDHVPALFIQLAFAYGFDMLLNWTRHDGYTLGFGPFPVIGSINLFLWFKPEYFDLQLLMVAVGFAAKDLLRWTRDGRLVHIFNPSSFPLAVASIAMLLTHTANLSYGPDIAYTQAIPPHMFLLLFLVALPGQLLFGVASMTVSAVVTTYLCGLIFLQEQGTYLFLDVHIPIPVFLGMLLLFTDPSTSPRTELGRVIFGVLYGLSTAVLYQLLLSAGAPTFYDKLLQVPLLNLSVRAIDRFARSPRVSKLSPERLGAALPPRRRYAGYTALWALTFAVMSATRVVGDYHPGQYLPYWLRTCAQGNPRACAYLAEVEQQMCGVGSGWACNEAGIMGPRSSWGLVARMGPHRRLAAFRVGCNLRFQAACGNIPRALEEHPTFQQMPPTVNDWPILLRGSRLGPVIERDPSKLYERACAQGWPGTCGPIGVALHTETR